MADDRARKLAESALNRLAAELQAGKSEAFKNYLATMGKFRRYSWGNVLLIASQKPTATRVAGIYTWNKLGRIVNEGEKGIMILAPILKKEREETRTPAIPGDPAHRKDDAPRLVGFRTAFVYDVGQTHGKALPEFAKTTGDPSQFAAKLRSLFAKEGISLEYDKSIAPAQGVSFGGKIRLLPDMQPAEEFSVLAHELAHEMLHHSEADARLPKMVVETQAEAVGEHNPTNESERDDAVHFDAMEQPLCGRPSRRCFGDNLETAACHTDRHISCEGEEMPRDSEHAASINLGLISLECVDEVVSFLPVLSSIPAKDIARWQKPKKRADGALVLSLEPDYHPVIVALMQSLNENHFVQPFDWGHWQSTAKKLFKEPNRLSKATLETCLKLITLHVRKDRFCGGHFGEMVCCGHIPAILRRLAELRESAASRT